MSNISKIYPSYNLNMKDIPPFDSEDKFEGLHGFITSDPPPILQNLLKSSYPFSASIDPLKNCILSMYSFLPSYIKNKLPLHCPKSSLNFLFGRHLIKQSIFYYTAYYPT